MWWRRSAENWEFDWVQVPENQAVPERSGRGGAGWVAGSGVGVSGFGPAGQTLCQLELREDVNPLVSGYSVLKDRHIITFTHGGDLDSPINLSMHGLGSSVSLTLRMTGI